MSGQQQEGRAGRAKGTYGTIGNWVLRTAPRLPLAAGWVLLALENQSNYDRSRGLTLAGLCEATGREPDQVRRGAALLLEYGMARQSGRTYLIGSGERAAQALSHQEERRFAGIQARTNARKKASLKDRLKEPDDLAESTAETAETLAPEVQEGLEGQEATQKRESEQVGGERLPPHSLSWEGGEEVLEEPGGACGTEAPDGATPEPARPVSIPFEPPAAETGQATSTQKVPPGGGSAPDPTRAALQIAFGPVFLAQLLSESSLRQGWLSLAASRVAEMHQQALETSGPRPWRTLFIAQLDLEVTPKPQNLKLTKPQEEWTPEEWLS